MDQRHGLVALIDMDGTIADYDEALNRDLRAIMAPSEAPLTSPDGGWQPLDEERTPYLKQRVRLIRGQPGWWRNLKPIASGMKVVGLLRKLGFSLNVLTKGPKSNPNSWSEKKEWCRDHLADATVTITEDKSLVYGKILFDDWPPYAESWLKWRPRGWVIMPAHPWNAHFSHPRVIRYDAAKMSLEELEEAILKIINESTPN